MAAFDAGAQRCSRHQAAPCLSGYGLCESLGIEGRRGLIEVESGYLELLEQVRLIELMERTTAPAILP